MEDYGQRVGCLNCDIRDRGLPANDKVQGMSVEQ